MMKDKQIGAMHRELDGLNSPEETAELKTLLGSDPAARACFEDLRKLGEMLDAVPEVDPPRELKAGVMRAVRKASEPATTPTFTPAPEPVYDGFLNSFLGAFRGRWAYALTFSAGIAAGILGFTAFGDGLSPTSMEGLTGTMAPIGNFVTIDKQDFNQAGVVGSVETRIASDQLVATVDVESTEDLDIVFEFDGNVLNSLGFQQSSPHPMGITVEPGRFTVRHHGENTYVFTLGEPAQGAGSEVNVKFYSGGFLFEKTLKTLPGNE